MRIATGKDHHRYIEKQCGSVIAPALQLFICFGKKAVGLSIFFSLLPSPGYVLYYRQKVSDQDLRR